MTDPELIELAKSVFHDAHSIAGFGRQCDDAGRRSGLAAAKEAVEVEMERQYEKACEFDAPGLAVAASMRAAGCSMAVAAIDRLGEKP